MNAKSFFLTAVGLTLAILLLLGGALAILDPFFMVRGVEPDQPAFFSNERYELAGLIRNQDYSNLVMGTSLVANYRASWFTQGLGKPTLKITFPSGWPSEFDKALRLAYETHPGLDTVYFGMDLQILVRDPEEQDVDLPDYLYNTDPLDDVAYYLNKESYIQAAKSVWKTRTGGACVLDDAYVWDGTVEFSRQAALLFYDRPESCAPQEPAQPWVDNADRNLTVFQSWIEEHPETQFRIWCAPYSMLCWDQFTRMGRSDAYLTALEYAWEVLTRYENVTLYSFLDWKDVITNLDLYADTIHCSGLVTQVEAQFLMSGVGQVTRENYRDRIAYLRSFVKEYDYDALFE